MLDRFTLLHGQFYMEVRRSGHLVDVVDEPNVITTSATVIAAHAVAGLTTGYTVAQIGYGSGTAAAAPGNTALTGAYVKNVDGSSYPAAGAVQFQFSLAASEANGLVIAEFGLLTTTALLFARKVRANAIVKDSTISLSGGWTITFGS